jgi:hypothetical protein
MAKKGFIVLALLALATVASCSKGPRVLLFNNTPVDLTVRVDAKTIAADIGPGQNAEFYPQPSQWIDFGMIGHLYEFKGSIRIEGYYDVDARVLKIQAEKDGRLYAIPASATFPVTVLPKQPSGFPLTPARKVDLT